MATPATIRKALEAARSRTRSAWERGVLAYALDLIADMPEAEPLDGATNTPLLNGARDWQEFSEGGCALICDSEIAERLCAPWELRKSRHGERNPNSRETWLDVQARALAQAARAVRRAARRLDRGTAPADVFPR
jgi:hypothetical protein